MLFSFVRRQLSLTSVEVIQRQEYNKLHIHFSNLKEAEVKQKYRIRASEHLVGCIRHSHILLELCDLE